VSDEALAALAARRDAAAEETARLAGDLSAARRAAAATLAAAVTTELSGLAMAGAQFEVEVRPRAATAATAALVVGSAELAVGLDGADDIEFQLRPHPQSPLVPVARGASGGELSRVMLALEVCLAGADPVPTMVFDEVDAGVGGRAAVEVGRRLASLARDRQVLVVTHLAQVAAYADRHLVVDRPESGHNDRVTASDVRLVTEDDRVTELARMLAGSDSATAREHAAELLASATRERTAESISQPAHNVRSRAKSGS
jgi:DNA repair protein RecN (Recombination protein N)